MKLLQKLIWDADARPNIREKTIEFIERWRHYHSQMEWCARRINPYYGGPETCDQCDEFDSAIEHIHNLEN